MVEFQPSKLAVVGSNPIARSKILVTTIHENFSTVNLNYKFLVIFKLLHLSKDTEAHVAQLVEHVLGKDEVTRSIRVVGSTLN